MCYNPRLKSILLKFFNTDILNLGGGRWYLVHWTGGTFVGSWASCTMEEAIYQCCSVDGDSSLLGSVPSRPFLPLPCAALRRHVPGHVPRGPQAVAPGRACASACAAAIHRARCTYTRERRVGGDPMPLTLNRGVDGGPSSNMIHPHPPPRY